MNQRHMERALQDVELDCAFAIFYFVGEPIADFAEHGDKGIVGWAQKQWPALHKLMVDAVTHVMRTTLEQIDAKPVELAGGPMTVEECEAALIGLEEKGLVARVNPQFLAMLEKGRADADELGLTSVSPLAKTMGEALEQLVEVDSRHETTRPASDGTPVPCHPDFARSYDRAPGLWQGALDAAAATPLPAPEPGVRVYAGWEVHEENPNLNTPDGADDFEIEP